MHFKPPVFGSSTLFVSRSLQYLGTLRKKRSTRGGGQPLETLVMYVLLDTRIGDGRAVAWRGVFVLSA